MNLFISEILSFELSKKLNFFVCIKKWVFFDLLTSMQFRFWFHELFKMISLRQFYFN